MQQAQMISADAPLVLASRASRLALIQAESVKGCLAPLPVAIKPLSTRGDAIQDRALAAIGGKGLFIKALEAAMLAGRADAAVHSAKDMESHMAEGTLLAAFLRREDRRDALVGGYATIDDLPPGGVVGTASVRREALVRRQRPDLKIRLLRGNVETRIRKLTEGGYDAIILAMAGLNRLMGDGVRVDAPIHPLDEDAFPPAAGQGMIALQALAGDGSPRKEAILAALAALNDPIAAVEATAERAVLTRLGGTCQTPIGVSGRFAPESTSGEDHASGGGQVHLTASLLSRDGSQRFDACDTAPPEEAENLGHSLAENLLRQAGGRGFITAQSSETGGA